MDLALCRICCVWPGSIHLFEGDYEVGKQLLYVVVRVSAVEGDGLPMTVCPGCAAELARCHRFVLQAESSDRTLRAALAQSLQLKKEEVIEPDDSCNDDFPEDTERYAAALSPLNDKKPIQIKHENQGATETSKKTPFKRSVAKSNVCSVCNRVCPNPSSLRVHLLTHTNEKPYSCHYCNKHFKATYLLSQHIQKIHLNKEKKYVCDVCGKIFTKNNIEVHRRTHTGETPYACPICPAKFTQSNSLKRHEARHSGVKPFSCTTCTKRFTTKDQLTSHLLVHTTERKYSCHICNVPFKYKSNIVKHMKSHDQHSCFVCNYCGRTFKAKGNLKLHIESQHSERSGQCSICSKTVANIEVHMRKHTGERPLKCELCPSTFFDLNGLAHHTNFRHKNTNKYKCQYDGCLESFPSQPMLDYHHAKLHTDVLPFPCDRCSRGFYRKNDLARHMIGTHKERLK